MKLLDQNNSQMTRLQNLGTDENKCLGSESLGYFQIVDSTSYLNPSKLLIKGDWRRHTLVWEPLS